MQHVRIYGRSVQHAPVEQYYVLGVRESGHVISPFITSKWFVRVRRYFTPTFSELLFLPTLGLGIEAVVLQFFTVQKICVNYLPAHPAGRQVARSTY